MTNSLYSPCQICHCGVVRCQVLCRPLAVFTQIHVHVIGVTLLAGVNPFAVNKYLSVYLSIYLSNH